MKCAAVATSGVGARGLSALQLTLQHAFVHAGVCFIFPNVHQGMIKEFLVMTSCL